MLFGKIHDVVDVCLLFEVFAVQSNGLCGLSIGIPAEIPQFRRIRDYVSRVTESEQPRDARRSL